MEIISELGNTFEKVQILFLIKFIHHHFLLKERSQKSPQLSYNVVTLCFLTDRACIKAILRHSNRKITAFTYYLTGIGQKVDFVSQLSIVCFVLLL